MGEYKTYVIDLLLPYFGCWLQDRAMAGLGNTNEGEVMGSLCKLLLSDVFFTAMARHAKGLEGDTGGENYYFGDIIILSKVFKKRSESTPTAAVTNGLPFHGCISNW